MLRIVAPTMAVSLALLLVGGLAAWYLHRLQRESTCFIAETLIKVEAAEEIQSHCQQLRNRLAVDRLLRQEPDRAMLAESREGIDQWIRKARALAVEPEERALLDRISEGYDQLFALFAVSFDDRQDDWKHEVIVKAVRDIAREQILIPAGAYLDLNRATVARASERAQEIADRMGIGFLLLGMCGSVAGLLAGYTIARSVRRSLAQMSIPIRDATGSLNQVIGPIRFSTEEGLDEMEAALHEMSDRVSTVVERFQAAQAAAARAQRLAAMGQMAAGLAHELRNPLTAMKILIQAAAEQEDGAALDWRDLEVLQQEIGRLDRIIQNYLDFARPPQLERSAIALRRVLEQTVELVRPRADQTGIFIDCRLPARIVEIDADVGQIRQVLLNLLLNAIDASPEGETIVVRMHFEPSEAPEGASGGTETPEWVVIEVMDRGPGLPPKLGDEIFEPFVSTKEAGTGLGLSICKRIVEDHGGHVTAENGPEGGAAFTVRLPVHAGGRSENATEMENGGAN